VANETSSAFSLKRLLFLSPLQCFRVDFFTIASFSDASFLFSSSTLVTGVFAGLPDLYEKVLQRFVRFTAICVSVPSEDCGLAHEIQRVLLRKTLVRS
jgi:hypothetical protein